MLLLLLQRFEQAGILLHIIHCLVHILLRLLDGCGGVGQSGILRQTECVFQFANLAIDVFLCSVKIGQRFGLLRLRSFGRWFVQLAFRLAHVLFGIAEMTGCFRHLLTRGVFLQAGSFLSKILLL